MFEATERKREERTFLLPLEGLLVVFTPTLFLEFVLLASLRFICIPLSVCLCLFVCLYVFLFGWVCVCVCLCMRIWVMGLCSVVPTYQSYFCLPFLKCFQNFFISFVLLSLKAVFSFLCSFF